MSRVKPLGVRGRYRARHVDRETGRSTWVSPWRHNRVTQDGLLAIAGLIAGGGSDLTSASVAIYDDEQDLVRTLDSTTQQAPVHTERAVKLEWRDTAAMQAYDAYEVRVVLGSIEFSIPDAPQEFGPKTADKDLYIEYELSFGGPGEMGDGSSNYPGLDQMVRRLTGDQAIPFDGTTMRVQIRDDEGDPVSNGELTNAAVNDLDWDDVEEVAYIEYVFTSAAGTGPGPTIAWHTIEVFANVDGGPYTIWQMEEGMPAKGSTTTRFYHWRLEFAASPD